MNETIQNKYYDYVFQYYDVQIKNIVLVNSKMIHLQLCLLLYFHNYSNKVVYVFEQRKFEMKRNDTTETKYYE